MPPPAALRRRKQLTPIKGNSSPLMSVLSTKSPTVLNADVGQVWSSMKSSFGPVGLTHLAVLGVLSVLTRMLWLGEPSRVVFDEFHFGRFVGQYFTGEYYFDIHPPLGKLTMAALGWAFGYDPSVCSYDNIDDEFHPECRYTLLRFIAASFGVLLPLQVYAITGLLGASRSGSLLAGMLTVFDMLHVIESRLVLTDSQLMFYKALALWVALKFWKRLDDTNAGKLMSNREHNLWLVGMGLSCGAALSIKWTTLATPGMIAIESTFGVFGFVKKPFKLVNLIKVLAVAFMLYVLTFQLHLSSLPLSGDGDAFMPHEFQQTLINSTVYDPNAPAVSFWSTFPELNREMLSANARIDTPHHWSSRWPQWIVNARGVLYWSRSFGDQGQAIIYLMGNPIVVWTALVGVLAGGLTLALALRYRIAALAAAKGQASPVPAPNTDALSAALSTTKATRVLPVVAYLFCTYWFNLLPYIAVSRAAFVYHYMPGQLYAILLIAVWMDWAAGKHRKTLAYAVSAASAAAFVYWAPWVYGTPLSAEQHAARRWLSTWD